MHLICINLRTGFVNGPSARRPAALWPRPRSTC